MDSSQIIDHDEAFIVNPVKVEENIANTGRRFANLIIDSIAFFILMALVEVGVELLMAYDIAVANDYVSGYLFSFTVNKVYYFSFEALFGKTLGKFITGTKVVAKDGSKPSLLNLLGRSVARLIPFDAFSFLSEKPVGWHDSLSGTRVILDR